MRSREIVVLISTRMSWGGVPSRRAFPSTPSSPPGSGRRVNAFTLFDQIAASDWKRRSAT